ncbi:MAG: phosphotransferase family protein [Sandaracinaceae bacterium]
MILPNPEREWARSAPTDARGAVEARLGPVEGALEVLAGGQASLCVGIGDKVLRVVRTPATLDLEEALTTLAWGFFRSPRLMGRGDDWLLLERVPHEPLRSEHGTAVGAALAEIHAQSFATCGWLDGTLRVCEPQVDFGAALVEHAGSLELEPALGQRVVEHLEAHARELGPARLLHGDFKLSNVHASGDTVLVLDWEYAYAGPALMDVGQLMRWDVPEGFVDAFERSYRAHGGELPAGWLPQARALDAVNLAALLARSDSGTARERDLRTRLEETLRRS